MPADIKLIATDLDGTLIGSANELPIYTDFRAKLRELRGTRGVVWAACTGRSRRSFNAFFLPMQQMNIAPEYIIVKHAYIYRLTGWGYLPHITWNANIRLLISATRRNVGRAIDSWRDRVTGMSLGVRVVRHENDRLQVRFDSEHSAETAADILREEVKAFPHLRVFQYQREVDVRYVPFTKGLAVSELARHIGVDHDNILAIGNGHNDISMLDGTVAKYCGCPANSDAEVMETVHSSHGHIASRPSLAGVMEIVDAFETGNVYCKLPPDWVPPSQRKNPWPKPRRRRPRRRLKRSWLWALAAYAVILVFASQDVLPFSGVIMKPVRWLSHRVCELFGFFW